MNFSPLRVEPIPNDVKSKRFFESFGCEEPHWGLRMLDDITGYMPFTSGPAVCKDPNPKRCNKYNDVALDADGYFAHVLRGNPDAASRFSAQTPRLHPKVG